MFERISDAVWRWHDTCGATSYLVVGMERAAMVDCGASGEPMMAAIRQITPLPIDLYLTHAHPDHYASAMEFERIWLHESDVQALPMFEKAFSAMNIAPIERKKLHGFSDGQRFDLGGRQLSCCALPGHTPGSTVFVDETDCCMFTGDAVGSGDIVLMSVPLASTIRAYRQSLLLFLDRTRMYSDYSWCAGHYHQAFREKGKDNVPCRLLAQDMVSLCDALIGGWMRGRLVEERFAPDGKAYRAYWRRAGIVYNVEQIG